MIGIFGARVSRLLLTFVVLTLGRAGVAQVSACEMPRRAAEVLRCAIERSPETERARLAWEKARAGELAAAQIANPTLSVQSGFLTFTGEKRGDHQVSLTQPIDWGGKRGSRVRGAENRTRLAEIDWQRAKAEVALETLLKLHRARQLVEERHRVEEARTTFGRLIATYRERPSLTPEQTVSLSVFRMAYDELDLRSATVAEEAGVLENFFKVATGLTLAQVNAALPERQKEWPEFKEAFDETSAQSPRLARARAEIDGAQSELDGARADSWPQLSVGPYALAQTDGGTTKNLYGVMVNLELPIFSLNGGGREVARKGVIVAEKAVDLTRREETAERAKLRNVYEEARNALGRGRSPEETEKSHVAMERMFLRGVIPSTLVIESHRQLWELTRSRNDREMRLLDARWRLSLMSGRLLEEAL